MKPSLHKKISIPQCCEVAEFEFTGVLNPGEIRDRITKPLPLLKKKSLVSRIVEFIRSHVDKYSN